MGFSTGDGPTTSSPTLVSSSLSKNSVSQLIPRLFQLLTPRRELLSQPHQRKVKKELKERLQLSQKKSEQSEVYNDVVPHLNKQNWIKNTTYVQKLPAEI